MIAESKLAPELRFPSFSGDWKLQRLESFFSPSRARGVDGLQTLSVTLNRGLVNRDDLERKQETNLAANEHLLARDGDIAYNMMRMWQGAFGRATSDGIVSPAYVVLRGKKGVDTRFFEHAFRRSRSIYLFWAYSYGLTKDRLRLYANDFARIPFSAPTLPEQQRIADFFAAVDKLIEQLTQKKSLLEDYKKGVIQQIFSQAVRFKDDHGNDFPDWEEAPLQDFMVERNTKFPQSETHPLMAFIANKGVAPKGDRYNRDFLVKDNEGKKYKQTECGDFIYSSNNLESGSIGLNSFGPASISPVYSIFYFKENCNSEFMGRMLLRKSFIYEMTRYRQGVVYGQWRIHEASFLGIKQAVPSVHEQNRIADFLSAIDRKIESVSTQITATQTFKRGLLQQMFV